ncbi:unnamed protein product [Hymenolepis diminuta]|uniref:Uncharacterized protein n=1 Tax=Hymenolepis diminuta TaxID=6216 RepID=A0A564YFQ0_HYMDI|nr:unnamed protein product [Hymenolepis diminuta]
MPQVVTARRVSEPTVTKHQSIQKSPPRDYQTNQICCLKKQQEGSCTPASSRTH